MHVIGSLAMDYYIKNIVYYSKIAKRHSHENLIKKSLL